MGVWALFWGVCLGDAGLGSGDIACGVAARRSLGVGARLSLGVGALLSRDSERRGFGVWFRDTGGGFDELGLGNRENPPGVGVDILLYQTVYTFFPEEQGYLSNRECLG